MRANVKNIIFLFCLGICNLLHAQSDYSKYRLYDSGYVDFTTRNTQFVDKAPFELPWLFHGKYEILNTYTPVGVEQANRYTFIQDTAGVLRYYADHAGVYSNRSGIIFKSYLLNKKIPMPRCWLSDSFYPIPNTPFKCAEYLDTAENFGYSNCVRFGKTNQYGIGIWDYLNNGFRLLRLSYDPVSGDKIVSTSILPNAGKLTNITCGPNDSTFWVVSMLKNMHTIQVYLWSFNSLQLNQTIEIGDTSHLKAYAHRMKFSPDNTKMVLIKRYKNSTAILGDQSNLNNTSYLFDFNSQNGKLSNQQKIPIYGNQLEFSPNSQYLYIIHAFSTMDSNGYLYGKSSTIIGYLSRFNIPSKSTKLLQKIGNVLFSIQLLPDGNIYWYNTFSNNLKYVFDRLENCNDTQLANFKKYTSNIDVVNGFRFNFSASGPRLYPEILPCKCYEPESKPAKIESCGKDSLVIRNYLRRYDSLLIAWGDGSSNVYKQIDSTFKHTYTHSGRYIVRTNYKSVFQEYTKYDTIITKGNIVLNIPKDTFFCPTDTLSMDLAIHDTNLVWNLTNKSARQFNQSGNFKYQYKELWCNFTDSIQVNKILQPWKIPFNDTIICAGELVTIQAPQNLKIQWDNNPSDSSLKKQIKNTEKHRLKFSDGICDYVDSVSVRVAPSMNLSILQIDTTICHLFKPLEFKLDGNLNNLKSVTWNGENTNSYSYVTQDLNEIKTNAVDVFGCAETIKSIPISSCNSRIYIPNAFTPNGFGPNANEYFKPVINDGILKSFKIYNRWGQKIFDNANKEGWDGNYQQAKAPDGIYIYEIEVITVLNNIKYTYRYSGNFQLIR